MGTLARNIFVHLLIYIILVNLEYSYGTPKRKAKCVIPKNVDLDARTAQLQKCIFEKYGESNDTRCYDGLGCFPMEDPWSTLLRPFPTPLPPEDIETKIVLYTRDAPEGFEVKLWPEISLKGSDFDVSRLATVFMTHGFASDGTSDWLMEMKDAYLERDDVNAFVVDWGSGASLLNYLQVASNTRIVGAELTRFGKYLIKKGLKPSKMHLIGHSLGAHIMAYMGKGLKSIKPVRRITALDPAQPGFERCDTDVRLDKDDAEYVDVLHSDAKPTFPLIGFGMMQPVGDVDFYFNGGASQPGCIFVELPPIKSILDLAKIPVEIISQWVSCSHGRACDYFTESLKKSDCVMWGRKITTIENALKITSLGILSVLDPLIEALDKCDEKTCSPVGLLTFRLKARGAFAVTTRPFEPFCNTPNKLSLRLDKLLGGVLGIVKDTLGQLLILPIF